MSVDLYLDSTGSGNAGRTRGLVASPRIENDVDCVGIGVGVPPGGGFCCNRSYSGRIGVQRSLLRRLLSAFQSSHVPVHLDFVSPLIAFVRRPARPVTARDAGGPVARVCSLPARQVDRCRDRPRNNNCTDRSGCVDNGKMEPVAIGGEATNNFAGTLPAAQQRF